MIPVAAKPVNPATNGIPIRDGADGRAERWPGCMVTIDHSFVL